MISFARRMTVLSVYALLTVLVVAGTSGCNDPGTIPIDKWVIGEMEVDPVLIPASGQVEAEISIWLFEVTGGDREPLPNVRVEFNSSRNQGGNEIDTIEQPTGDTDGDGRAVGFIGSALEGEAQIKATQNGAHICAAWENESCVELAALVTFYEVCTAPEIDCGGECVNPTDDPENCGGCGLVCTLPNATAACVDSTCVVANCDANFANCDDDDTNGCEADLTGDPNNCGACGTVCTAVEACVLSVCTSIEDCDVDGDGHDSTNCPGGDDCDDDDDTVFPGASEICDGKDNDCNTEVDEDAFACDDGNDCTDDLCERGQGCVNILNSGITCDDNDDCTINDVCQPTGSCAGEIIDADGDGHAPAPCGADCDDTNSHMSPDIFEGGPRDAPICTDGVDNDCDGATDGADPTCNICTDDAYCDNGNACDGVEWCDLNANPDPECMAGTPVDCDDGEQCTDDICDPTDGSCTNPALADGTACDDSNECTLGDACGSGTCQVGPTARNCNDAMPCTDDSCDPATGCLNDAAAMTGVECRAVADVCDVAEICDGTNVDCPADEVAEVTTECRPVAGVCDIADFCDGTNAACPADVVELATTECRAVVGVCDIAENCDGVNGVCPADVVELATTECRASAGVCDIAENCDGATGVCPADVLELATTECRAAADLCDLAELCDGVNVDCPADAVADVTLECRPVAGLCDVPEVCDGVNIACPADVLEPNTTECRAAAGLCDIAELCDGVAAVCPVDVVEAVTTECRASAGVCDLAENCDGVNGVCPADAMAPVTTECRPAADVCDAAEFCDGVAVTCPVNDVEPNTTECRAAAGVCDIAENCNGVNVTCPADAVAPVTTQCRAPAAECDAAENCDGVAVVCPADLNVADNTPCTTDNLFCTGPEQCQTGTCVSMGNPCPVPADCDDANDICGACGDGVVSAGEDCDPGAPQNDNCCNIANCTWTVNGDPDPQTVCSGAADCFSDVCDGGGNCTTAQKADGAACGDSSNNVCDNPDTCLAGTCEPNREPATTQCRAASGVCDVAENCDGVNVDCPADALEPSTTECRAAVNVCDRAENCDGVNVGCPVDGVEPVSTVCRASAGVCDLADRCDGVNVACPA
ncbi:hypothetical protein ACFL2F_03925, partial [Myxococcota bacterium]